MIERIANAAEANTSDVLMNGEMEFEGQRVDVNFTIQPLVSLKAKPLGTMLMIEDISTEKRMKSTMSRYMDPALADRLLAGNDMLGGQSLEDTVLFSDIRSFTTLTEELGPQGTVTLLNDYFSIMVNCISREGGMLDKFVGDAMMAEFGIPVAHDDDPDRAVRAAISMIRELGTHNDERRARGQKPIRIGIGMSTDAVVSGNIGSPKRMDYTVIGDGVNVASRLEGACKEYSAQILCSESTYQRLKGTYRAREIDRIVVKGKVAPVGVYEILDFHTGETFPNLPEALSAFRAGLTYYRAGEPDRALAQFREALALNPQDAPSSLFAGRCEHLKAAGVPPDWDGIWVMQTK